MIYSFLFLLKLISRFIMTYTITKLAYNSQCIAFPEWVSLLTLCLAPLIAHVASGAPQVSYLAQRRPRWFDYLCHYNPTSILWRYAAITDRRIRASRWDTIDIAATNAIFWTSKGWDGSENMVTSAALHCTRLPEHSRVELMSVAMLKTLIVTLQGVSALYSLVGNLAGVDVYMAYMGVDSIFFPLAIIGLLRLCAAFWLTDDFAYALRNDIQLKPLPRTSKIVDGRKVQLVDSADMLDPLIAASLSTHYFKSTSYWPSWIFRAFFLLVLAGVWFISFTSVAPFTVVGVNIYWDSYFTTTSFLAAIFYFILLTISTILYAYYFIRGFTTSTVLPYISSTWYRLYTLFIMAFAIILIIIASIETNKFPGGSYTSMSLPIGQAKCASRNDIWTIGTGDTSFFGFTSSIDLAKSNDSGYAWTPAFKNNSFGNQFLVYNFSGYCIGKFL